MGKVYLFAVGLFWLGCSASAGRPLCNDPNGCNGKDLGGGGVVHDMALSVATDMAMSTTVVDLLPGAKMFGDPCGGNSECASGICILSGIGGTCSQLCDNTPCPEGYGCFGVLGAVDPGQVANVCVSNRNELCTPCQTSSECSATSQDVCYTASTGGSFCGTDCTTVSCPTGYNCQDITVSGTSYKQCIPQSNACDCNATLLGAVKNCPITTPFGTCTGMLTCQGATGWSACNPPSLTDVPDDTFTDNNCDGIDGDVTKGIFVAVNQAGAADNPTCGTYALPCKSINYGINQAAGAALTFVYVQAGVYNESVTLFNGINVVGGYDSNWQRATASTAGHEVRINGTYNSTEAQFVSLVAHSLVANTTVWDLNIVGPNANDGVPAHAGLGSYGVHAVNAKLTLKRVGITAGNGSNGSTGSRGTNASPLGATGGMVGNPGNPANEFTDLCDDSTRESGGSAGTNSCAGTNGGGGGPGGQMDSDCECSCDPLFCISGVCCGGGCNAQAGGSGTNAATVGGSAPNDGVAGAGGAANTSAATPSGDDGRVANGTKGLNNSNRFGHLVSNYWFAFGGGSGGLGLNGGGGGGGGGSGGNDNGEDQIGGGGGGGGAGGCAATAVGGAGGGGGGSFGILAINSTVTLTGGSISLATGGSGGVGGQGGTGQDGGGGGTGGSSNQTHAVNAGNGGHGANGGHSGGGAGGNGGNAYGIYSSTSTITNSASLAGGNAGAHGTGGAPATSSSGVGTAPGANGGDSGNDGFTFPTCTYPTPGGC